MANSFFDRDGDGDFDITDAFWWALQLFAYGGGIVFMLSTATRSFHLLSSSAMMPTGLGDGFSFWPYLTAAAPEVGLIMAWLSGEVGFRKGKWQLIAISIIGGLTFAVVIGTMNLYDVALLEGGDLSGARGWAHTIAAVLPLITIAYSAVVTMILSAMARWEKVRSGGGKQGGGKSRPEPRNDNWTLNQPQPRRSQPEYSLPKSAPHTFEDEQSIFKTYGEPVSDPAINIRAANHKAATELAESNRGNGSRPKFK